MSPSVIILILPTVINLDYRSRISTRQEIVVHLLNLYVERSSIVKYESEMGSAYLMSKYDMLLIRARMGWRRDSRDTVTFRYRWL